MKRTVLSIFLALCLCLTACGSGTNEKDISSSLSLWYEDSYGSSPQYWLEDDFYLTIKANGEESVKKPVSGEWLSAADLEKEANTFVYSAHGIAIGDTIQTVISKYNLSKFKLYTNDDSSDYLKKYTSYETALSHTDEFDGDAYLSAAIYFTKKPNGYGLTQLDADDDGRIKFALNGSDTRSTNTTYGLAFSFANGKVIDIRCYIRDPGYFYSESDHINAAPTPTPSPTPAVTATPKPTAEPTEKPAEESSSESSKITTEQISAIQTAKSYLKHIAFSHDGLVGQLEYEGYSHEDSVFAADNCGADWNAQATACAKSYLKSLAFSYSGLIEQLEYEGFTEEQAQHGADRCEADWDEQAVACAKSYLKHMDFSHSELVEQLEYEGFTAEQAEYGATQAEK